MANLLNVLGWLYKFCVCCDIVCLGEHPPSPTVCRQRILKGKDHEWKGHKNSNNAIAKYQTYINGRHDVIQQLIKDFFKFVNLFAAFDKVSALFLRGLSRT